MLSSSRMNARFPGRCACGARVGVGAPIAYLRGVGVVGCASCDYAGPATAGDDTDAPAAAGLSAADADAALDAALGRLNPSQAAIAAWDGASDLRVVACAGAGKTATVVALVGAGIRNGWDPRSIVVTTFTSKAGAELRERLGRVLPGAVLGRMVEDKRVGTFHARALRILRTADADRWALGRCLDAGEATRRPTGIPSASVLWRRVLTWGEIPGLPGESGLDLESSVSVSVRDYALAYDVIRSRDEDPAGPAGERVGEDLPGFREAAALYDRAKRALRAFDFGDLLTAYMRGLESGRVRDAARIVIVDEAQDNDARQIRIARAIARQGGGAVCMVGDARQSIYSWRGAAPDLFFDFPAPTLEIPTNYRSGRAIVDVGNRIAAGAAWAAGSPAVAMRGESGTVRTMGAADCAEEAAQVAAEILAAARESGAPLDHTAILTRTNALAGIFEAALLGAGVPCAVVGGSTFFGRAEILDALAWVSLVDADADTDAHADAVRRVVRGIAYVGRAFADAVAARLARGEDVIDAIRAEGERQRRGAREGALGLAATLEGMRGAEWPAVLDQIAESIAAQGGDREDGPGDLARALARIGRRFEGPGALVAFAARCRGEAVSVGGDDGAAQGDLPAGRVVISTIHRAKGLEWPTVYVSATAGIFPHVKCADPDGEERRLFYVAATRARDVLVCTWAALDLAGRPAGPSSYLGAYVTPPEGPADGPQGPAPGPGGDPATPPPAPAPQGPPAAPPPASPAVPAALAQEGRAEGATQGPEGPGALRAAVEGRAAYADAATAAEPPATGEGEGARYVPVSAEGFEALLGPAGFEARSGATQREWWAPVPGRPGVTVRIYSTIPVGQEWARDVGEDSIRVSLVYADPQTGRERALMARQPWACRTRGWRRTLIARILTALDAAEGICPCRACDAPTVARRAKATGREFRGCIRYPECRGAA